MTPTTSDFAFSRLRIVLALCASCWAGCSGSAPEKPQNPPNILFAIADDAGFPFMSAYGVEWVQTPGFDRVAREGLLFMRAYTPNAKCAPSRAAILTERNSWQLEQAGNHMAVFPAKFKSFMEALGDGGYFVGKTQKGWGPGIAPGADGVEREITGKVFNERKLEPPAEGISNNDYAGNFVDFLDANADGKPWAFWYGSVEPHRRYEYGAGAAKAGKKVSDIQHVPAFWPDNEVVRNDMLDYAYEVEYFDSHLQRMLAEIEERGELDNTLVVVTADHGMPFPRVKGQEYEMSNHVPLAMMWKNGVESPGRTIADYVSFVDLAPTFLELAGVDWERSGMQPAAGRTLTEILLSPASGQVIAERDHLLIGKERHDLGRPDEQGYPIRGIFKGDMLYLRNFETDRWPAGNPETGYLNVDGSPTKTVVLESRRQNPKAEYWAQSFGKRAAEELYDVAADPDCIRNLADDPEYRETKQILEWQMMSELNRQGDPRVFGNGHVFDEYGFHIDTHKGFYERFVAGEEKTPGWINASDVERDLK